MNKTSPQPVIGGLAYPSRSSLKGNLVVVLSENHWIHISLLIGIVLYCFGRTLGSYFLADDFGEVLYVHRIFHGEPNLLWSNFTGNYMQIPSMCVYRPWLLISLIADYVVWHTNAFGYYLTNILYFAGDSILLYILVRQLTRQWSTTRSSIAAFFSAAIFASYGLHSESVSWVVGRVDVACSFYYLMSLVLLLKSKNTRCPRIVLVASLLCYWLGLLTKEMAIGLPVVASAIGFALIIDPNPKHAGEIFSSRLRSALSLSWPFWASTLAYFIVRYLALGTLVGGYVGSIGHGQLESIFQKWNDIDTLKRLFFPLNFSVFQATSIYHTMLSYAYWLIGTVFLLKVLLGAIRWPWILLLSTWLLSTVAPIYQLWGLGYNLEGSRFYFFFSIPFSIALGTLCFAPCKDLDHTSSSIERKANVINVFAMSLLCILFCRISYCNNIPWVHAGKTVQRVQNEAQRLARSVPTNKRIIVLGIPKDQAGAHMILNGATFSMVLSKPFVKDSCANHFLTFDPILFGNSSLINPSRFKSSLQDPSVAGVVVWDSKKKAFTNITFHSQSRQDASAPDPILLDASTSRNIVGAALAARYPITKMIPCTASNATYTFNKNAIQIENPKPGDGFKISNLSLNPLSTDYLKLTLSYAAPQGSNPEVSASWTGQTSNGETEPVAIPAGKSGLPVSILLPLSRYWRWYAADTISSVNLHFSNLKTVGITNAHFVPSSEVSPILAVKNQSPSSIGLYQIDPQHAKFEFNCQTVAGAAGIEVQVSKPNYFFEYAGSTSANLAAWRHMNIAMTKGQFSLDNLSFTRDAYYQVRVHCMNIAGNPVGAWSDPLTLSAISD